MHITHGLLDGQVLQRTRQSVSDAAFGGSCNSRGTVFARVQRAGKTLRGFSDVRVGTATRGKLSGRLKGIPAGGPYTITLSVAGTAGEGGDRCTVQDVLVGDVWILAGQSNMQGCGNRDGAVASHPMVRAFTMDDRWRKAKDPIHNLWNAVDSVHGGSPDEKDPGAKGVGPGVSFGRRMHALTGVPQGLIACAHGGTSMAQWDPAQKKLGGASLYGATIRRFHKNGSSVAGIIWYQGESDANETDVSLYTARMKRLVRAFRRNTNSPRLPFAAVQLCWYAGDNFRAPEWNSIQDQQRKLPEIIPYCTVVPAIDLTLDDQIHVSAEGQAILGRRLAEAMCALTRAAQVKPPIALGKIRVVRPKGSLFADVIVEFRNVEGGLKCAGRVMGFSLNNDVGPVAGIYHAELRGNRVVIRTLQTVLDLASMTLHYGSGTNPPCNVHDGAGRPLPVFGPVTVTPPRCTTGFVRKARVSRILPGGGSLDKLPCPRRLDKLGLETRSWEYAFMSVYYELSKVGGDAYIFYVCDFKCPEAMPLSVLVGYDGPAKIWIDGKVVLHDPNGTNPAIPDDRGIPMKASAGDHRVVIALGSNDGNAWGAFLRFERVGVPRRALIQYGSRPPLPEIIG